MTSMAYCILFVVDTPPTRMRRADIQSIAVYGFVDASSSGFGSSFALPDGAVLFHHSVWERDMDSLLSNFKEL